MDQELKQYLDAIEARIDEMGTRIDGMETRIDARINASEARLVGLITEVKESLERELHAGFTLIADRFDTQAARLDRHAALLQTGSRWINR